MSRWKGGRNNEKKSRKETGRAGTKREVDEEGKVDEARVEELTGGGEEEIMMKMQV